MVNIVLFLIQLFFVTKALHTLESERNGYIYAICENIGFKAGYAPGKANL